MGAWPELTSSEIGSDVIELLSFAVLQEREWRGGGGWEGAKPNLELSLHDRPS